MVVVSCYLEVDKDRVLEYQANDSFFKISATNFYATHLKTFKLSTRRVHLSEQTRYMQS